MGRKFLGPEAKFLISGNEGEDPANSGSEDESLGLKYVDPSIFDGGITGNVEDDKDA